MSAILNNDLFGWDLLYTLQKDNIRSAYDLLVAFAHWALVKKGFRCVGLGSDYEMPLLLDLSECMPPGWSGIWPCKIIYIYNFEVYILASAKDMGFFCVNLLHPFDLSVKILHLEYDVIIGIQGALQDIMPDYLNILHKIQSTLIYPFIQLYHTKDQSTQVTLLDAAFYNVPRELIPLVQVLKKIPKYRNLPRCLIDSIIKNFETALNYLRNPQMPPEISSESSTDDDEESQGDGNSDGNVNQVQQKTEETQTDGHNEANGPNDDVELITIVDRTTSSDDVNATDTENVPDFFGSLLQEEPNKENASTVNEQKYLPEPLEPIQLKIVPKFKQNLTTKLINVINVIDNILAKSRTEYLRKLDPFAPQGKENVKQITKPEEHVQKYLIECATEGAIEDLSEEDLEILKLQKIHLFEANDMD